MTRWIPHFSVTRPVTIVTAFLVIVVVGIVATFRIPLQMMPSGWDLPYLWIWVPYGDSTPTETETRVLKPLEDQIATVPGIKRMSGEAQADGANLSLEFHSSVDMDEAYNAVTDRVERARLTMPEDADRTYVFRFDPNDEPVIWAGIAAPADTEDYHFKVTRIIQKRLSRVPGVGRVDVWGLAEPVVWIEFNREALIAHGLDLSTLVGQLMTDNFQLAAGEIQEQGEVRLVRVLSHFDDIDDIRAWPVRAGLTLGDVASVEYKAASSRDISRINGKEGAGIGINKESSANTVDVCREILAAFKELEADPRLEGFTFPVFFDQGAMIEDSLSNLLESAVEGGVLAVFVLILFLRQWRITALITATIPATLLLTMIVLSFSGSTLNLLSMLGIMLAVGMVVDNAVVVVESIHRRRQAGEEAHQAAIDGTAEVLLPIVLSTLTSVVVFLPIILLSGDTTTALFLGELGMPVVYIQIGSLLITLFFTPLSTVWLGTEAVSTDPRWLERLAGWVDRGLHAVLTRPMDSFMGIFAMVFLTFVVPAKAVGCSGDMEGGITDLTVRYTVPSAYTYPERIEIVKVFEALAEENLEEWGVRVYVSRLSDGSNNGRLNIYLDEDKKTLSRDELLASVKSKLPDLPGVNPSIGWSGGDSRSEQSIRIHLRGEDTAVLNTLSTEARRRIRALPGVLSVQSEAETEGNDEVHLRVDREAAARLGVSGEMAGRVVSFAMRGMPLTPIYQGEKEIRVVTKFASPTNAGVAQLLDMGLMSPLTGALVPLRSVVAPSIGKGPGSIHREDRATSLSLKIDLEPEVDKTNAYSQVEAALSGMDWPLGYGLDRGNEWEEQMADQQNQMLALLLSVVFVFLIMGLLFESFLLPMAVITTVPMAALGVWWGLWATGTPFDGMAAVGMIILIGIVVNNGIVLVDFVTELRAKGVERTEALREAVRLRLRPILMTALSAIVGVIPMAIGGDTFVGIPYAPLGRVIACGMFVATILTLFFLPFLYQVLDDLRTTGSRWFAYVRPLPRG